MSDKEIAGLFWMLWLVACIALAAAFLRKGDA